MIENETLKISWRHKFAGWLIHIFTASGAYVGLLSLLAIYNHRFINAFWLMGIAIVIDAVDGMFARKVNIKLALPQIDGALLDNIVDFFNYTIVPCFFLLVTTLIPSEWRFVCIIAITLSSAYQFTQVDAKTSDHFFKGFPSYWNIAVFYLFFWELTPVTNLIILLVLAVLSFIPIKFVYPSRMEYLTHSKILRLTLLVITIFWGLSVAGLLWVYPNSNRILVSISMGYLILYIVISLYRTWVPLKK